MSDSQPIEVTAPLLEDAIEKGLAQLGLARSEVIIEIVQEGNKGVLGMGSRDAIVRLTPLVTPRTPTQPRPARSYRRETSADSGSEDEAVDEVGNDEDDYDDYVEREDFEYEDDARIGKDVLRDLLDHMHIDASIRTYQADSHEDEEDTPWILDIRGQDLGILIGRRGETLDALQYLTRQIVSRELERRANIVLDVEGYKSRREKTLEKLARRMASQARKVGRTMVLEPMPPNERRIIHITLRDDDTVTTESVGEGDRRKVTIIPVD